MTGGGISEETRQNIAVRVLFRRRRTKVLVTVRGDEYCVE